MLYFKEEISMQAVIIAAGNSSRLWPATQKTPKTLLPFGNGTILSTIMENLAKSGTDEFIIVTGFKKELIKSYLAENDYFNYHTTFIDNLEWKKSNGISVLAAEEAIRGENFILSMSDHIVTPTAIKRIKESTLSKNLLLVDPDIDHIFDKDDATKVEVQNQQIIEIGKELKHYNGIDCGIFRLTTRFFSAMREQLKQKKESISAAIQKLIENDDMASILLNTEEWWIDIDTPAAYQHALSRKQF
jgi:choline kinase